MYHYFIYFIVALIIYSTHEPLRVETVSIGESLTGLILLPAAFAAACRLVYGSIERTLLKGSRSTALLQKRYLAWNTRLTIAALALFGLSLYLFNVKYFLHTIPLFKSYQSLSGLAGLSLFVLYLVIQWACSYPLARMFFVRDVPLPRFVTNRLRLSLSILFPWFAITLLFDLVGTGTLPGLKALDPLTQELLLFGLFLGVMILLAPLFMKVFWGLTPLPPSRERTVIERACRKLSLSYRDIVLWPLFEGEMITAGIMGLVGRFRYLMISPSLLSILDDDELEAVVGHEVGHIHKHHLVFYVMFLLGYLVLVYPAFDFIYLLIMSSETVHRLVTLWPGHQLTLLSLVITAPVLLLFVVYFRYIFGYFIRNFERQADLYSLRAIGRSGPLVTALEKIASYSGDIREVPSWHHFSIAQRVDVLRRGERDPDLVRRHDRKVRSRLGLYLILASLLAVGGYSLTSADITRQFNQQVLKKVLARHVESNPRDLAALAVLATLHYEDGQYAQAEEGFLKVLASEPHNAEVLNNLAWIYATSTDRAYRRPAQALDLARRAASLSPSAHILDTLAESYYVNGLFEEAVEAAERALALKPENPEYYRQQLDKFRQALQGGRDSSAQPGGGGSRS